MTSSKTSSAPLSVARSRRSSRKPSAGGTRPMFAGYGSARIAANSCSAHAARPRRGRSTATMIVFARRGGRDARAGRDALRREAGARLGEQAVDVAVVGAGELQELLAAGRRAGEADRAHRRLGARARSCAASRPTACGATTSSASSTSPAVGAPKRRARRAAASATACDDRRVRVAVDQRAPRADPVDVAVAVDVDELGALAALDEDRVAADRAHRADRRVHAAGQAAAARARRARRSVVSASGTAAQTPACSRSQSLKSSVKYRRRIFLNSVEE